MSNAQLEKRIAALEAEVAGLKLRAGSSASKPWWETTYGIFANDPAYDEAMRLGREYRESTRPAETKSGAGGNGRRNANGLLDTDHLSLIDRGPSDVGDRLKA